MNTDALPRLCYERLGSLPVRYRPAIDPQSRDVRIVHLGIGAFHRAHQAFYTEQGSDWGICGVSQRSADAVHQLAPQNCLYTLAERENANHSLRIIGAVRDVMFAGDDPEGVVRRIANQRVSIVTTTVTEKGYHHDPASRRLRFDDAEIAADLASRSPRTVVGQIAAGIAARAVSGGPPLTVVCCDNLPANGTLLASWVRDFLERSSHPRTAVDWLDKHVAFPSTMVDRITPATTAAERNLVASELGVDDRAVVVTEPFTQWVIEQRFAGDRPAWESAGALLVDDVSPYEQLKLRMLNGPHSALAYLGGLAGYATIAEAVADQAFATFTQELMANDIAPALTSPAGIDLSEYQDTVLRRFANSALGHRTRQVAMDGSHKLPQRLLSTIRDRRAAGAEPLHALLAVAAWIRHVTDGRDDQGNPFEPDDPLLPVIRAGALNASTSKEVVAGVLGINEIFGDLVDDYWIRNTLAEMVDSLARHGALEAVRAMAKDR